MFVLELCRREEGIRKASYALEKAQEVDRRHEDDGDGGRLTDGCE